MRRFRIREKLPSKWIDILFPEMKRNSNADVTSQTLAEPNAEITLPNQITKNVKVMKEKMSFGNAVAICFSKYFTLKGRARRSEYWYFYLFSSIVGIFVMILKSIIETSVGAIGGVAAVQLSHIIVESFYWIITIALFIPGFTVFVRRLHDIDDNGWLAVLLYIVPSIIVCRILYSENRCFVTKTEYVTQRGDRGFNTYLIFVNYMSGSHYSRYCDMLPTWHQWSKHLRPRPDTLYLEGEPRITIGKNDQRPNLNRGSAFFGAVKQLFFPNISTNKFPQIAQYGSKQIVFC
jgi:uncharacterized membrane protein YhaH (DUF805 family)